jgi:diaminohydroxyphosphoribosylaminopyrimidine deaminase/5-amino-6-(5-phosphoribosylamino)uracil reductase
MIDHSTDEQFLQRALDLARQGIGLASPNPLVGAVIVDPQGNIAGKGVYTFDGLKHAEVLALKESGDKARGGTLFINLEPHSHQGRTPPCTDALIAAGIKRVVASMPDPNPRVSGQGFEKLRAAGIRVDIGILEAEARCLNEAFARYIRHGIPLVTLKAALTLDGKIAAPPNSEETRVPGIPNGGWITGEPARAYVHQQRYQSDAILVGVGTVLADDPLLTDRSGNSRRRQLLRVILDSHLRLPLESRLVRSLSGTGTSGDVLVFYSIGQENKKNELESRGIRVERLPQGSDGRPDIRAVLRRLGQLEIASVMIEGGSTVNGAALASGVIDKLFLYYSPKIMAAPGAVPFVSSVAFGKAVTIPRVKQLRLHSFGEDFAVEGYLRDPYGE